jgi:tRNA nucleotidyltransferase/poly(A) polymerase
MSLADQLARAAMTESEKHDRQVALMKFLSRFADRQRVGKHVYVVGGAVRDFVLNTPIKDIDMMIDSVALKGKDAAWFARKLQAAIPVKTNLVTNKYGVAILTVVGDWKLDGHSMKGEDIEIATARKESYGGAAGKGYKPHMVAPATAKDDVARREFTFNTLMWRLSQLARGPERAEIVDITGCGLKDLKAGVMKCPSNPDKTFSDDPSRMLRAVKFMVRYNFKIHPEVAAAIKRNASKLRAAPPDAIAKILIDTVLKEKTGRKAVQEMKRLGLLDVVADMIRENALFRNRMKSWAANRKLEFLFHLMDVGLPLGARLDFLSPAQQKRLRQVVVGMPEGEPEEFLAALKQPGRAVADRKFIPALAARMGATGKKIAKVAHRAGEVVRELLLKDPEMFRRPAQLRKEVERQVLAGAGAMAEELDLAVMS